MVTIVPFCGLVLFTVWPNSMSAAGLIIRFLILVVVVPVLFWSLLIIVELQLKSGVPLPGLRDCSITENDAYEPSGVFAPPASVGMVQVNVFVVLSNVSVPGCMRLYDITLNAFPILYLVTMFVAVVVPRLFTCASIIICCL